MTAAASGAVPTKYFIESPRVPSTSPDSASPCGPSTDIRV
jgi:hypothetical protein